MKIKNQIALLVIFALVLSIWPVQAEEAAKPADGGGKKQYTLDIIGTAGDDMLGDYFVKTGLFRIDVSHIDGAYIRITSDDFVITGRMVEWSDNYLLVTDHAKVEQKKMTLVGDKIEYFSEDDQLEAEGNLEITTEDALIVAEKMIHLAGQDRTEFLGSVVIQVTDGKIYTDRCIMLGETDQMQFIGTIKGEFDK